MRQKGAKVRQKGAKREPKGAKGSQKEAKGSQKGVKGEPSEPRGDQNASKSQPSEKALKMIEKGGLEAMFGPRWASEGVLDTAFRRQERRKKTRE